MCGIAGLIGPRANERLAGCMLAVQVHRGPDGDGLWSTDVPGGRQLVLGHRRLSIIDLSERAAQPMADISGRYVITYNGEFLTTSKSTMN